MTVAEERAKRLEHAMRNYRAGGIEPFVNGNINMGHVLCEHIDRQERAMENMAMDIQDMQNTSILAIIKERIVEWWYERKQRKHERTLH